MKAIFHRAQEPSKKHSHSRKTNRSHHLKKMKKGKVKRVLLRERMDHPVGRYAHDTSLPMLARSVRLKKGTKNELRDRDQ